jgi:hypothetical protein
MFLVCHDVLRREESIGQKEIEWVVVRELVKSGESREGVVLRHGGCFRRGVRVGGYSESA